MSKIRNAVANSNVVTKAYSLKLRRFRKKIPICFERRNFIVKTVENDFEFRQTLSLRYEVFHKEKLLRSTLVHYDTNKFDKICDHLIVVDKEKTVLLEVTDSLPQHFLITFIRKMNLIYPE